MPPWWYGVPNYTISIEQAIVTIPIELPRSVTDAIDNWDPTVAESKIDAAVSEPNVSKSVTDKFCSYIFKGIHRCKVFETDCAVWRGIAARPSVARGGESAATLGEREIFDARMEIKRNKKLCQRIDGFSERWSERRKAVLPILQGPKCRRSNSYTEEKFTP